MKRCQIEVVFSPARPDLDGLGLRADPGGFVYRVRDDSGRVRVGGSASTLDPLAALHRAKRAAVAAGFKAWRSWNAGGAYVAIA